MKPCVRVDDRSNSYMYVDGRHWIDLDLAMKAYVETGIDRVVELDSIIGTKVMMRVSDIVTVIQTNEESMREAARLEVEMERINEEARNEEEPSWI